MGTILLNLAGGVLALTTNLPGTLDVQGLDGFTGTTEEASGGVVTPDTTKTYTLRNIGTTSINWTASEGVAWISLSATSGTLAAGASTTVIVSFEASSVNSLADGAYSAEITFTNTTNGLGNATRTVSLTITAAAGGGGSEADSIAQYGITWEFDDLYECGQYVNGDWWVVGPVQVTSITRPQANANRDGSGVNPSGDCNPYDNRISASYTPYSGNVANSLPLTLSPGESLCSVISHVNKSDSPNNDTWLKVLAVLTCVSEAPAANAFRPNFNGATKYEFTTDDVNYAALPSLSVSGSPTSQATLIACIERPWPLHTHEYVERQTHPSDNFPGGLSYAAAGITYGRDLTTCLGECYCVAMSNAATVGDKTNLVNAMVQKGIDTYGALKAGAHWIANGGHNGGKKAIILFAGKLLNDAGMLAIGTDYPVSSTGYFAEDMQTFEVAAADVSRTLDMEVSINVTSATSTTVTGTLNRALNGYADLIGSLPLVGGIKPGGAYIRIASGTGSGQRKRLVNCTQVHGTTLAIGASITFTVDSAWGVTPDATSVVETIGYETSDGGAGSVYIGMPEWGISRRTSPIKDNPAICADYRCSENSAAWVGQHLMALALSLQTAWAHDEFFDYMDRWMAETAVGGNTELTASRRSWCTFCGSMWDAHRGSY